MITKSTRYIVYSIMSIAWIFPAIFKIYHGFTSGFSKMDIETIIVGALGLFMFWFLMIRKERRDSERIQIPRKLDASSPVYVLTKEGRDLTRKRMQKNYPLISLLFLPAVIALPFASTEFVLLLALLGMGPGIAVLIALGMFLKMQLSTKLIFDNNQLTMQIDGRKDVCIRREEVDRVVFVEGEGYQISAHNPPRMIRIPLGLQNYEQLSHIIRTWSKIDIPSKSNKLIIILIVLFVIACTIFYRVLFYK